MAKNPFDVLGIPNNATQLEAQNAYYTLRDRYMQDRFLDGPAGMQAAKNLTELEQAYYDVREILATRYTIDNDGDRYSKVADAIKNNQLDTAQQMLDAMTERSADWHYYQALIFYKQDWLMESRKQLQMAISLAPDEKKYSDTLARLESKIKSNNPFNASRKGEEPTVDGQPRSYTEPHTTSHRDSSNDCCKCIQSLICIDCCCECVGSDCISCC